MDRILADPSLNSKSVVRKAVALILGGIAFIAYIYLMGWDQQDTRATKTYHPAGQPNGTYVYDSSSPTRWFFFFVSGTVLVIIGAASIGDGMLTNTFAAVLSGTGTLLSAVLFIIAIVYAANCNKEGNPGNACHDRRFCCATPPATSSNPSPTPFYLNAANKCPYNTACTGTLATLSSTDLMWDDNFTRMFIYLILNSVNGCIITVLAIYSALDGKWKDILGSIGLLGANVQSSSPSDTAPYASHSPYSAVPCEDEYPHHHSTYSTYNTHGYTTMRYEDSAYASGLPTTTATAYQSMDTMSSSPWHPGTLHPKDQ